MRESKFRGKRIDNDKWVYGDLIHCYGADAGRIFIKTFTGLYEVDPTTVGENIELFKALAAMNDENDMQQLFICDTYADIGCVMWHLCENKKFKHYYVEWEDGETDIRNEFRKATVEEIIKHFKKS